MGNFKYFTKVKEFLKFELMATPIYNIFKLFINYFRIFLETQQVVIQLLITPYHLFRVQVQKIAV